MVDLGQFVSHKFDASERMLHEGIISSNENSLVSSYLIHNNSSLWLHKENIFSTNFEAVSWKEFSEVNYPFIYLSSIHSRSRDFLAQALAKCADLNAKLFIESPASMYYTADPVMCAKLGQGSPDLALIGSLLEYLIKLSTQHKTKLHILGVSTDVEVKILINSSQISEFISSSTPAYLLAAKNPTDGIDSPTRLSPGLVGSEIQDALLNAVEKGAINAITSHHTYFSHLNELDPLSADEGAITLPTLANDLNTISNKLSSSAYSSATQAWPEQFLQDE